MSWDSIKESKKSDFLKVKDGQKVRLHILDEKPEHKVSHYVNEKYLTCDGAACHHCNEGVDKRESWKLSVYNFDEKRVQTLEQGKSVFGQIDEIRDTYKGEIKGLDFVISRKGSGPKDTKYKVIPVPTEFKAEMVPMKVEDVPF